MDTKLFIIKQRGRDLFWSCSAEHGSGWTDGKPKQSFSPSELVKEIRRLIDEKWFTDIEVCELILRDGCGPQECRQEVMPGEATKSTRCHACGKRV